MSQPINNGGPAMHMPWNGQRIHEGISIRDYFAAAIMQGLMASQCEVGVPYPIYAYAIADAMIKAREVKP